MTQIMLKKIRISCRALDLKISRGIFTALFINLYLLNYWKIFIPEAFTDGSRRIHFLIIDISHTE